MVSRPAALEADPATYLLGMCETSRPHRAALSRLCWVRQGALLFRGVPAHALGRAPGRVPRGALGMNCCKTITMLLLKLHHRLGQHHVRDALGDREHLARLGATQGALEDLHVEEDVVQRAEERVVAAQRLV